jgi:hypothetical protein
MGKHPYNFMQNINTPRLVHLWTAKDPNKKDSTTGKPLKHEIREHADGQFTILSYTSFGTQTTYGPYDSLAAAKLFLLTYNQIPKDAWSEAEIEANA